DRAFSDGDQPELWTPRDIWVRFTQEMVDYFREDRRIEYKTTPKIDWEDLSAYYSAFSNTPDGGIICIGVSNKGKLVGCSNLSQEQLNRLENFHIQFCPQSRPEIKRVKISTQNGD